jgi:cytochrome c oxidase assembly protein subunit 15
MASLGDTLFPARTLAEGLAQDRNPALSVLLHIRVWHPVLAIVVGIGIIALAARAIHHADAPAVHRAAMRVIVAVGLQWCVGMVSLLLLVPVPLQLAHLLLADGVWLSLVWLAAEGSHEL